MPFNIITVYASGNPLNCDCSLYELHEYLNGHTTFGNYVNFTDDLVCHYPIELRGKLLRDLKPHQLECNYSGNCTNSHTIPADTCVDHCTCSYKPYDDSHKLDCSHQNFRSLPSYAPRRTKFLFMNHNLIDSLAELSHSLWEDLTEIRVENNVIKSAAFIVPENVTFLGLKNNKLAEFPTSIRKHAEKVKHFKLTLSENLWPCDCSILPLKTFLLKHGHKVTDLNEVMCSFPNRLTIALGNASYTELCPSAVNTEIPVDVYISIAMLVIVLIAALMLLFYYKKRLYILSFFFTHCNGCYRLLCCGKNIDEKKRFDGFIAYSSKDADVAYSIIKELEGKPPNYRFCLHERGWKGGAYIVNNIFASVRNSRKTLVVISDSFVRSKWFHVEFQAAFHQSLDDKTDRLIVIVKGDMPDSSLLEDDVRFVLATKTYLRWGDRWFFDKLRYALQEEKPFVEEKQKNGRIMGWLRGSRRNNK